jgi:deoxyribonuclease-4
VENPKKSYAPYKYEIEMLRAGKFDPDMKERIVKEHEKSV